MHYTLSMYPINPPVGIAKRADKLVLKAERQNLLHLPENQAVSLYLNKLLKVLRAFRRESQI